MTGHEAVPVPAREIRISFSMHPRWVDQGGLKTFLEPLRRAGLTALEFELDDRLDGWPESRLLMEEAVERGLELSFHAPYRAPHSLVGFAGERRSQLEQEYRPLLEIAEGWARLQGGGVLVVHAAASQPPADPAALVADTLAYLGWAAQTFPHLRLALENNHPAVKGEIKVGIQREQVLRLVDCLPPARLGICWDMGHDYLSHFPDEPSAEWLERVMHVHVHDVDATGDDHYPLVFGNVPHGAWLRALKQSGMQGIVVLELKGDHLRGWPMDRIGAALAGSIETIVREVA